MKRFALHVNGEIVDYQDFEGLPFSLTKRADKFLALGGSDGVQLDNLSGEIALPYTGKNARIFGLPANPASPSVPKYGLEAHATVNGTPIFNGSAYYERTQITSQGNFIVITIAGDEVDPYSRLKNINLRDLDLGSSLWTQANMVAGFNSPTLPRAIWAPVAYGVWSNPSTWEIETARPHIQEKAILEAIMAQLGYAIESEFHNTEYFARQYYIFGVGSLWETDSTASPFRGRAIGGGDFSSFDFFQSSAIPLPFFSFPVNPSGQMNSTGFTCQQSGYYDVVGKIVSNAPGIYVAFKAGAALLGSFAVGPNGIPLSNNQEVPFNFPRTYIEAGTSIEIYANGVLGETYTAAGGTFLEVSLIDEPQPGNPIKLSSCLHDRTAQEWLLGIMHKYCLVGKFDNVLRKFQYEPRFNYTLWKDGTPSSHPGWYQVNRIGRSWDGPIYPFVNQESYSLSHFSDYGNALSIGYAKPEDGSGKAAYDRSRNSLLPDEYKCIFADRGQEEEYVENPYYLFLPVVRSNNYDTQSLIAYFPDDYETGDSLPIPSYEGAPASAMYFGPSPVETISLDGTNIALPRFYQKPALADISGWTISSYTDTDSNVNGQFGTNYGLGSTFWLRYLLILRQGDLLECQVALHDIDFEKEEFRLPVSFASQNFILLDFTGYMPTQDGLVNATLIKDISPTNDQFGSYIRQNYDVDTLLVN